VRGWLACAWLAAAAPAWGGGVGTSGANLLKASAGARELALGGAATALAGDLSVLAANPALLVPLGGRALELMHWPGAGDSRTEYAGYSVPLGGLGWLAGSVVFRTLPTIDNEDAADAPIAVTDGLLLVSFARRFGRAGGSAGVNLKLFNGALGDVRASTFALDAGAVTQSRGPNPVRYGLAVLNLGSPIRYEEAGEPLPLAIRLGAAWSRAFFPHGLTLAADATFDVESNARFAAGAEWLQSGRLALRGGAAWSRFGGGTFAAGGGWRFRSTILGPEAEYRLDYAFVPFATIGSFQPTNVFSLFVRF
jgi:hypothetical protein